MLLSLTILIWNDTLSVYSDGRGEDIRRMASCKFGRQRGWTLGIRAASWALLPVHRSETQDCSSHLGEIISDPK